jgi:hypothetical protein
MMLNSIRVAASLLIAATDSWATTATGHEKPAVQGVYVSVCVCVCVERESESDSKCVYVCMCV